jgi:hypothetical protein
LLRQILSLRLIVGEGNADMHLVYFRQKHPRRIEEAQIVPRCGFCDTWEYPCYAAYFLPLLLKNLPAAQPKRRGHLLLLRGALRIVNGGEFPAYIHYIALVAMYHLLICYLLRVPL